MNALRNIGGSVRLPLFMASPPALKVFVSYAHEDESFKDKLIKHLAILKRQSLIDAWQDRQIRAGEDWQRQIDAELEAAEVILLLISSDFLASDFCWGIEMTRAIERHDAGTATVIPVILRSVEWDQAPFAKLQALPKGAQAVNTWDREDDAFADIAKSIRLAVEALIERRGSSSKQTTTEAPPSADRAVAGAPLAGSGPSTKLATIKVGILLSRTGTLAMTEAPMIEAALFAIQELNDRGGLLGRRIEPIVQDAESVEQSFETLAEKLIQEHAVSTIFGCCTSSSRKTVKPVVEEHDHLLVYPMQHEGLELSRNIIYLGSAPNQQFLWAAQYLYAMQKAKRVFLIGSDYVYPHAAAEMIRDRIEGLGGEIVGNAFVPLGSFNVSDAVREIADTKPDVIMSQVVGGSNLALYQALRGAGIGPPEIPTLATNMTVGEIRYVGPELLAGNYSAWSYFMEIGTEDNRAFLERFQAASGATATVSDPMEALYSGVLLWAQAVTEAGTDDVATIREAMLHQSIDAPEGRIEIDPETQYARRISRLARIESDGRFKVINRSEEPVIPEPYPSERSVEQWDAFLQDLYEGWGRRWENPTR